MIAISIQTQDVQTASAGFFVPVVVAWAAVFVGLEVAHRFRPLVWPGPDTQSPPQPRREVVVAVLVAIAILGLGQLWSGGIIRWHWQGEWDLLAYALAQAIIWSPLPLALWIRRQSAASAWTSAHALPTRLVVGAVLGAIAVTAFLALRGELGRWPEIAHAAVTPHSLAHALPVYMEGVGLAFLWVRLRWAFGRTTASILPALLFAIGHLPRDIQDGTPIPEMLAFFAFNTAFVAALLALLARYRDVVALGVAHYLMDLATKAF